MRKHPLTLGIRGRGLSERPISRTWVRAGGPRADGGRWKVEGGRRSTATLPLPLEEVTFRPRSAPRRAETDPSGTVDAGPDADMRLGADADADAGPEAAKRASGPRLSPWPHHPKRSLSAHPQPSGGQKVAFSRRQTRARRRTRLGGHPGQGSPRGLTTQKGHFPPILSPPKGRKWPFRGGGGGDGCGDAGG
ncbi:hypothetical protein PSCLAVI8L_490010 [Pseudoclavibacter sp. 8L]|nr:hypothetical protein PSCLAVI8L_490010 [Pseudoclavibacter sp. 8L]